ncbi:MAG: hypothetical protein ACI4MK_04715 [Aristaeellaceae bacterium]
MDFSTLKPVNPKEKPPEYSVSSRPACPVWYTQRKFLKTIPMLWRKGADFAIIMLILQVACGAAAPEASLKHDRGCCF